MMKLAKKIEDRKRRDLASGGLHWLIAYTYNPEPFPEYFKEQFELVSLDSKDKEKKNIKLRGIKKYYAPPETKERLIKKYLKEFPEETRHVIALKVNKSLQEEGGRPLEISTLKKDISYYRNKKKKK